MSTQPIVLSEREQAACDAMLWEPDPCRHDAEQARRNGQRALALTRSLRARGAIPEARRSFFTNPEYNPGGRGCSRLQIFERSGTRGDDILRHPHFLQYLRYFIFGCALPGEVVQMFADAVDDCGSVTSGDIAPLSAKARALARSARLEPKFAAEEFFKLALDLGLSVHSAAAFRTSVLRVKPAHYG